MLFPKHENVSSACRFTFLRPYVPAPLDRVNTSFIEESEERSSFLWQIISCSLIKSNSVRNFQRFSNRSFVSAFELIFILKIRLDCKL